MGERADGDVYKTFALVQPIRTRSVQRKPVGAFAVRLHATGCTLREIITIFAELGVERSHEVVWNWVHQLADSASDPPSVSPMRVTVNETAVKSNGEWSWV